MARRKNGKMAISSCTIAFVRHLAFDEYDLGGKK